MDEFDVIDPSIAPGTVDYWKARARQWQKRCQRAEAEKTELIKLLNGQQRETWARREIQAAVQRGDSLGGQSGAPRPL